MARRVPTSAAVQALQFRAASALEWVDDSTVALLDVDDGQVVLEPVYGGRERRVGRKGAGPGEFRLPVALLVTPQGEIVVADGISRRLTRFDADLRYVSSVPVAGAPIHVLRSRVGRVLVVLVPFAAAGPEVVSVDLSTGAITGAWRPFDTSESLAQASAGIAGPNPFVAATMDGLDRLVIGGGTEYRLFRFTVSGSYVSAFGRGDVRAEEYSETERAERERGMERMTGGRAKGAQDAALRALFARPKPFFGATALEGDDKGGTWVLTSRSTGGNSMVDAFAPDGSLVGTVTIRDRAQAIAIRGTTMAVLVQRVVGEHEGQFGIDVYELRHRSVR